MESTHSDAVIARYLAALGRMGDMYSRQTVSLVLTLATEEAVAVALTTWESATEVEVTQLNTLVKEISRQNVDLEARRQDWQREAEEQRAAANSSFTKLADLRTWLVANDGDVTDDLVAAAIAKLNAQQDRIDALRAANETLHQRLTLMPQPTNGHDAPASPLVVRLAGFDWSSLSPEANDYRIGIERGSHVFRRLPLAIRLELVQSVLRDLGSVENVTMADFDTMKPNWMPTASGLPRTFGCSWAELATLTAPVLAGV